MAENLVIYSDLGLIGYGDCLAEQQSVFNALLASREGAQGAKQELIVCEHPHVYTLGRSGNEGNLLVNAEFLEKIGAQYYHTDRGGDITYHGPGQLVAYPILDLQALGLGLKEYVHALEETVIMTLEDYGIHGGRNAGATGVWLEKPMRKICAIGVRSSRFVTMHGLALNVNTQLEYFGWINPCGFKDSGVTSMERELGRVIDMEDVKKAFTANFEKIMNVKIKIENHAGSETMGAQASG